MAETDPQLRSDARRNQQRILRAAARLLADDGAATTQQIADSADGADAIEQLTRALARIAGTYPILLSDPGGAHEADAEGATSEDRAVLVARFEAEIGRGQRDGSIRSDLAPAVIRHALFGALS